MKTTTKAISEKLDNAKIMLAKDTHYEKNIIVWSIFIDHEIRIGNLTYPFEVYSEEGKKNT